LVDGIALLIHFLEWFSMILASQLVDGFHPLLDVNTAFQAHFGSMGETLRIELRKFELQDQRRQ